MPLTKEQSSQVRYEVDHAGLVNQVSCTNRINALSAELQCDTVTMMDYIRNYRQQKKRSTAKPTMGPEEPMCNEPDQQPGANSLHELNEILVQKPRKLRISALEKMSGYSLFLRKLGKELEDVNKALRKEDSQAELVQMKDFQMITSESGDQLGSKLAALSQKERDEYEAAAKSASEENSDATGNSGVKVQEAQRKSYLIMVAAIRNFVKNGGTHIGILRLPFESDNSHRISTLTLGDFAEQTMRQSAKADIHHQPSRIL
ncbi:hypothetical protein HDU80_004049, partial [Chytriomyces hyalinus]